ncbi:MAG TPA: hypothetical protein ENJ32_04735 [Crenotrichaceae bacterium]|nr:hypothetical protein [Crenotrichaceae bacterium]
MRQLIAVFFTLLYWFISAPVSSAPLPYQSADKHLGVGSCASTVCHGSVQPNDQYNVQLNEYVIWSQRDSHAKAYQTLLSKESRAIAGKLGLENAQTARICLDCHADNIPKQQQGDGFQISDGVGCEACHGGSENWIETHTEKQTRHLDNVKRGMYPTDDFTKRAELCLSCHLGNDDKFATHQIMGAGHPRLSFELDTFQALQPAHFQVDDDYRKRKPTASHTKIWAYGQIAATKAQLNMLQTSMRSQTLVFPELAVFDCHACHNNSMHHLNWQRKMRHALAKPGNVPIADGHLRMTGIIARQVNHAQAKKINQLSRVLQKTSGETRLRIATISAQLYDIIDKVSQEMMLVEFGNAEKQHIVDDLITLGINGAFRDYIGSEQLVMAIELIIIDIDKKPLVHQQLDALYKQVENDDTYQSTQFINVLKNLKAALR